VGVELERSCGLFARLVLGHGGSTPEWDYFRWVSGLDRVRIGVGYVAEVEHVVGWNM
jgi:hypothetical protein